MQVSIIGGGITGLACGVALAERGARVELFEQHTQLGPGSCSWCAGGMLAPWCELEDATEPLIAELGLESLGWWRERFPGLQHGGTLVLAAGRDLPELARFAQRTQQYRWLTRAQIGELEPDLAGRFEQALHFPDECHLDPRQALSFLAARLRELGGTIRTGAGAERLDAAAGPVVDCRGLGARADLPDLRGVRGEMLLLRSRELSLRRPVRLLHPRLPLYVVPRDDDVYMVGATMLENDGTGAVTARSALELLSAAYALHPAFGEAQILELGAQARPAFADNLPRIRRVGGTLHVNGLYRHGFLLAPALAVRVAQVLLDGRYYPELMHEDRAQRRLA
jgi:glycine oxidase